MLRKLAFAVLVPLAVCLVFCTVYPMAHANVTLVSSGWDSSGNLVWYDKGGNEIFHLDGTTRALVVPSGSSFSNGAAGVGAGTNGAQRSCAWGSELVTLATGTTVTDTAANLLPATSIIEAVVGYVQTTITASCTGWELGDPTTVTRFTANDTTLTAGESSIGLKQFQGSVSTDATGPVQTAAAKVRITCAGGNPGAGKIRVEVLACTFTAPTS